MQRSADTAALVPILTAHARPTTPRNSPLIFFGPTVAAGPIVGYDPRQTAGSATYPDSSHGRPSGSTFLPRPDVPCPRSCHFLSEGDAHVVPLVTQAVGPSVPFVNPPARVAAARPAPIEPGAP